ncbi:hypothetical protein GCM10010988_25520 [Cnuibacter physcomitrellae]|nr:hypothetical protein GCM10010988_25520 [Cnuibacter physcomitrellae]
MFGGNLVVRGGGIEQAVRRSGVRRPVVEELRRPREPGDGRGARPLLVGRKGSALLELEAHDRHLRPCGVEHVADDDLRADRAAIAEQHPGPAGERGYEGDETVSQSVEGQTRSARVLPAENLDTVGRAQRSG